MLVGFIAGVVGATLGIGGGILLIPIWMNVGIDKNIAVSSTPLLILTSAMIAFTLALFNGSYKEFSILKLAIFLTLAFVSSAVVKCIYENI